jgi:hypothetical protein
MAKIEISHKGERVIEEFTALVKQPTTPATATPADIGLVEISQSQPTELIPGPVGPQGPRGSRWTTGSGDPSGTGALLGDMYLDDVSGAVWTWDGTQWVNTGTNIQGSPDTGPQILAKLAPVDGAASGLDADLLDGQHGVFYSAWANLTGKPATFPPTLPILESDVTNLVSDLALKAPLASPVFSGDARAVTPATADNDTSIATTAHVQANAALKANVTHTHSESDITNLVSDLALKAPLASPALTGTPTAPTATAGTNTTQLASTAFVTTAVAGVSGVVQDRIVSTPADMSAGFKTAGNRFVVNDGPSLNGTDVMTVTEAGAVTATSVTSTGGIGAVQNFTSSTNILNLNTTGAGTINLRPNGVGSTTGQTTIDSAGTLTTAGSIISSSGNIQTAGTFFGPSANTILGVGSPGPGVIALRPTFNSSANQTSIDANGNMTIAASLTAATGNITSGVFSATGATYGIRILGVSAGVLDSSVNVATVASHHRMYNTNGQVGAINTTNSTTAYLTSSDENLKDFIGPYDPLAAIEIIRADPVRDFRWKVDGSYAVGWGAQTSYNVSQDLASPPPPRSPEEIAVEGVGTDPKEPGYNPWGMDQAKRTPYLWAALSHALDKIDQLETRIAALEGV